MSLERKALIIAAVPAVGALASCAGTPDADTQRAEDFYDSEDSKGGAREDISEVTDPLTKDRVGMRFKD